MRSRRGWASSRCRARSDERRVPDREAQRSRSGASACRMARGAADRQAMTPDRRSSPSPRRLLPGMPSIITGVMLAIVIVSLEAAMSPKGSARQRAADRPVRAGPDRPGDRPARGALWRRDPLHRTFGQAGRVALRARPGHAGGGERRADPRRAGRT